MRLIFFNALLISLFFFCLNTNVQKKIITCVGASITSGARIKNPQKNSYPGQLQSLLGADYIVNNFGVGSSTMLRKGNSPYWNTEAYQQALKSNPDIVKGSYPILILCAELDKAAVNSQNAFPFEKKIKRIIISLNN